MSIKTAFNIFIILCLNVCCACAATRSNTYVLLKGYYEYGLNEEVEASCREMMKDASASESDEITKVQQSWQKGNTESIRNRLVAALGDSAKSEFATFVAAYSKAEAEGNEDYLAEIVDDLNLKPDAADYNELRSSAAKEMLASALKSASAFLGEIETWLELGVMELARPPLEAWILRGSDSSSELTPRKEKKRSLRDAEASAGTFKGDGIADDANPLDALSSMRDEKRAKQLKEAEAGMAMIAKERQTAEKEYADKKMSKAKKEADAQVAQAKKLAAAQTAAIEQRKNSWGNRLKNIVGATVTAAGGAFMGHVGAEAGQMAVNAVFK